MDLGQAQIVGCCKDSDEPLGCIKCADDLLAYEERLCFMEFVMAPK
jgi:hypothetical protein